MINLDDKRETDYTINGISAYVGRFQKLLSQDIPTKRSGLNEITDLRLKTAKLLDRPIEQVYGLTKNWSKEELYKTLRSAEQFINPPALWWKIYKEKRHIYGKEKRTNKKRLREVGQNRRSKNSIEGQISLFESR